MILKSQQNRIELVTRPEGDHGSVVPGSSVERVPVVQNPVSDLVFLFLVPHSHQGEGVNPETSHQNRSETDPENGSTNHHQFKVFYLLN